MSWTTEELAQKLKDNPALKVAGQLYDYDSHMATDANAPKPPKYHNQRTHPEKDLEQFVHDTAKACGLLYYHTYRSQYSEPGFPDCIIIGKIMLVAELKATGKHPTALQQIWLYAFEGVGITTKVWHPEDKEIIILTLKNLRGKNDTSFPTKDIAHAQ